MKFLKIIIVFHIFITFFLISFLINMLFPHKNLRLKYKTLNTHFFSRILLKSLGIKLQLHKCNFSITRGSLIISNHMSYIDMILISSILPVVFVASVEVNETPILGLFARCGGTIFIERRKKSLLNLDIKQLDYFLSRGFTILLFPEGTTSKGDSILPFKSSLFNAVVNKNIIIENLCIKYISVNDSLINHENRNYIYYYGEMTFWSHFSKLLEVDKIFVKIFKAGTLNAKNFTSRKELSNHSYKLITEKY